MSLPSAARQRRPQRTSPEEPLLGEQRNNERHTQPLETTYSTAAALKEADETEKRNSWIIAGVVTLLALVMRFWKIEHPAQVVFDEVHFGAFAGQYIRREYYFDVHPPLAKMLNALSGWLAGFNGDFGFDNIGDDYLSHNVPYVPMRAFCALMGAATVPVVYAIMRESGYPILVAAFSASLVLFDNAHITQSQLILLDAALILFMSLSLLSYIKFHALRYREFTPEWWAWLFATGFFLACTLGCKMVGLFTFMTVGAAVVWDLWQIMDIKRGNSMTHVAKHFFARAAGLIVWPLIVYLFIFWVHFRILIYSGPGDTFMSPAFQETLQGNELLMNSQELRYYDTVTIKHKDTKVFLHSHAEKYPLRYDDGRISSQGQQVTGYGHADANNEWEIIPTHEIPDKGRGRVVRHKDIIQLLHKTTNSYLLTHDVASPLMPTNQEFTTWPKGDDMSRYNDTLFQLELMDGHDGEPVSSKSGHFKLVHVPTRVALWTYTSRLPDWAFNQQEVNGNKNLLDKSNVWFVDDIVADGTGHDFKNRTGHIENKPVRHVNFFKKFIELQVLMLQHNAGLTSSHPYASEPFGWPFLLGGISFWTDNDTRQQIYLMGNVVGWWLCVGSMSIWGGIMLADALSRRRGVYPIEDAIRNRMLRNTGFFMIGWACHYFPFYLMNRQRFLHHYLPAHLISTLVAGTVVNFITTEIVNYPVSKAGLTTRLRPRVRVRMDMRSKIVTAVLIAAVVGMWYFLSPLTYGSPGLTGEQVNRRKLLKSWSLHFEGVSLIAQIHAPYR
ncbi:Dolichyl-phosphate-mannose--protein mannosyltransferase 4 [Naganishia albida]|nr:Dolichyl-phosphate-mannose--protein mannosyltransferase 4 [Naganishia albida]